MVDDVKRRAPYFLSDWTDAWDYRVVPATVYMYFAKYDHHQYNFLAFGISCSVSLVWILARLLLLSPPLFCLFITSSAWIVDLFSHWP